MSFPDLKKNMLLIVMVAVVTRTVSLMLEFKQFCMHELAFSKTREKWLYVSFAYINNLYKTIQQNNKAPQKANERLPFVQGKIMVLP